MIKYTHIFLAALGFVSCKRPVLAGGYESRKVEVMVSHKGSGRGGYIDTDQGVSERQMNLWSTELGRVKDHYKVVNVTQKGFDLEYAMMIENPRGSKPRPFKGTIFVPYKHKAIPSITGDYNLTARVY